MTATDRKPTLREIKPTPNPDVVDYLERLAERARTGEIQSIAMISACSDGFTGNGWSGLLPSNVVKMIGELEILKREILDNTIFNEE